MTSQKKARVYTWYVQPLSPETNAVISEALSDFPGHQAMISNLQAEVEPGKIEVLPLFEIPAPIITMLNRAKRMGYAYRLFVKEGNGKIRPAKKLYPQKKNKKGASGQRKGRSKKQASK